MLEPLKLQTSVTAAHWADFPAGWTYDNDIPYWRIIWVPKGNGWLQVGREARLSFAPDCFYLLPARQRVQCEACDRIRMYWTHFTVHVFGVYDALDQVQLPWMAPLEARHRDAFERLMSLFPASTLESLLSSQSIVLDMLSTFTRGRAAERLSGLIRRAERFSGVLNFMNERLSQPIRLGDLARAAYLEPTYFSAEFKRTFGLSPMRYLNRLRIEEAQRRLLTSEASITEVADAVGFCDAFHFSKRFKDCAGCSPSQYRERQVTAFRVP